MCSSAARHVRAPARCAPRRLVERAEDAAAREQHDDDQQEAEPELPVDRVQVGQVVVRDHEHGRADEAAVEAPGAAQHQHDHEIGGARKAEHVEADELRGLREQPARDAGHRGADRVDRDQAARRPARRSPACASRSRACRAATSRTASSRFGARTTNSTNSTREAVEIRGGAGAGRTRTARRASTSSRRTGRRRRR